MKRMFFLPVTLLMALPIFSENNIESYNVLSANYSDSVHDCKIIRPINGGTVIMPYFDESCPEEIKAPFMHACKIIEEYMPPCLPLSIKVSCGNVNGRYGSSISRVKTLSIEDFGNHSYSQNAPMSMIKGVILAELSCNSTTSFLSHITDNEFLVRNFDIEITYDVEKLGEMSFSLEASPGNNYDFVSVVLRDIAIGLGLSSAYRYDPVTGGLKEPGHNLIPFECIISEALGNYDTPAQGLENATRGELVIDRFSDLTMKLYAPSPWQNGISLNYFIPQPNCNLTNILSYEFCKGMVTRDLSDNYSQYIFYTLLGWRPNVSTSLNSSSYSSAGSTSLLMPYNGALSFRDAPYGITTIVPEGQHQLRSIGAADTETIDLYDYVYHFHPFLYDGGQTPNEGLSICVLKKDGTWDLVKCSNDIYGNMTFNMSDLSFNCDASEYARIIDGYLRARITIKDYGTTGTTTYHSKFFVIDYLPQKIGLSYTLAKKGANDAAKAASAQIPVKIYFSNTEGINRIVLERLRQGARVPSKIEVPDIKKGYFETTIDRNTTFTAVAYNDNGSSRSLPVTIVMPTETSTLNFRLEGSKIIIEAANTSPHNFTYTIQNVENPLNSQTIKMYEDGIDISQLSKGIHILVVTDRTTGSSSSFKFTR